MLRRLIRCPFCSKGDRTVEKLAENCLTDILKPGIQVFDGEKIYLPTAAIELDKIVNKTNVITYKNREGRVNMQPVSNSVWFAKMKNTKKHYILVSILKIILTV